MSNNNATVSSCWETQPAAAAAGVTLAQQRLRASAYPALRKVRCETEAGTVILRGRVSSFYFKQLAQEAVRKADDAYRIRNELEVDDRCRSATNDQASRRSD